MSRKNKFLVGVSPLGLLALSACGGGTGGGVTNNFNPVGGKAQSGPLSNATVFLDYNKDGVFQVGETTGTTDADGAYSLTPTQATYNVVVTTDAGTTDSTIKGVVSGLTLVAPQGVDGAVTMVTPATTMVAGMMAADASLTASAAVANVATALGFDSTKYNPLTFDAFADTSLMIAADKLVYDALALEVEKTSKKIMTVVNTFAAAIEGSGASEAVAFTTAFGSVTSVLTAKIAASAVLDFDVAADITAVTTQLTADISKIADFNKAAFDSMTTLEASIANVVSIIDSVTDMNDTANAFQTIGLLTDQVKLAAENSSLNLENDGAYKGQDANGIAKSVAVTEAAPALIIDGVLSLGGSVTNSVSQRVTVTSTGNDSALSFTVVGTTGLDNIDAISVDALVAPNAKLALVGGAVVISQAQKVTITSAGDDATVTFRIVGTDASGNAIAENLLGASLSAATSLGEYLTITSITASGAPAGLVKAGFVPTALTEVLTGSNTGTATTEGSFLTITSITADGASAGTVEAGVLGTLTTVIADPAAISVEATVLANAQLAMVGGGTITPAMATKVTISSTGDDSGMSFLVSGTNAGLANANGISTSAAVGNNAFLDIGGALAANIPTGGDSGDVTNAIAHKVTITSTGDDSGITFTIVGTDALGGDQTENLITGANIGTATSTKYFLTITSIKADGDPVSTVSAGISGDIQEKVTGTDGATATTATLFETITGIKAEGTPAIKVSAGVLGNVSDASISFSDASLVQAAKDNTAPVDITVASTYLESDATLSVGNLSTVDANQGTGHKYTLVGGPDAALFTLTEAGALSFVTQPDYETKDLYSIDIQTKDSGSKTFVKTIEIAITDADEAPVLTAVGGVVIEDDAANNEVTGTLAGVDPEGAVVTFSVAELTGAYGGQLVLDVATGAYTYTMNNDNGSVQELQAGDTLTETFTVSAFDGAESGSGSLSFTIQGVDDVYLAAPTAGALIEGATATVAGTLAGSDPDTTTTLNYSISGSIEVAGSYAATGTYGTLTVDAATGEYVYALNNLDADTNGLVKDAVVTETFKVKVDNGTGRSTKDLTIQITGINDDPVVTPPTTGSLTEAAGNPTVSDTLVMVDADTGETAGVAFAIVGGVATGGNSVFEGTYGSLSLNLTTGLYTYTFLSNDADSVALTAADNVTDTFDVTATDVNGGVGTGTLSIAIAGSGITINAIATDDKVNKLESAGFNITGRGNVGEDVTLTFSSGITLAGTNTVTVDPFGDWSLAVTAADVTNMGELGETVTAEINGVNSNVKNFAVDTVLPTTTFTGLEYDTVAKELVFDGTNFDKIGAAGTDVKSFVNWANLVWDTDGDTSDNSVTFAASDITSAIVTSGSKLTVTLTADKAAALEATVGFAAATAADNVDITAGFSTDAAGNAAITDGASNMAPDYSDTARPTVTEISSSTANGNFKQGDQINITVTLSELVLSGSGISVTLNDTGGTVVDLTNTTNGNVLTGTYTVPSNTNQSDLSVASFAVTGGKTVSDLYGNLMNSTTLPAGENLGDNQNFSIDTSIPINTIDSVQYDSTAKALVFTGTQMTTIEAAGTDVKDVIDWTKLNWDIDGDNTATAGKTFVITDITSAIVTSATVLTVTLTSTAAAALEATVGFAADGLLGAADTNDTIDVQAGFSVDLAGNPSETDNKADMSPTYTDGTKPTVTSFTTTSDNKSYKEGDQINITANMSEVVLDGSSITVTLSTSDTVDLIAATNGTTLVGTYTVPSSKNSGDLAVSSYVIKSAIKDLYGNTLTDTALPTNANLNNLHDIVIDTTVPTSTITGVSYGKNATTLAPELVFTGTNLGGNLADLNTDVVSSLDWSKLVWDIDADADNVGVTFSASDFVTAIVTSSTTLTATLTADKAAALEGTTGFAADGLGATNTPDNVDITAGFLTDLAGNAATTDAAADLAPSYTDGTKPTVSEFNSTTLNGGYKVGDVINITATMSEAVLDGAQITVTLDTGDTVALTAATNGTTLTGDYTVGSGDNSTDLEISSYAISATVSDLYGNTLSDTSIPASENLSDNKAFVIDTAGPTNTITGATYNSTDKTLTLAGAGFNTMGTVASDVKSNMDWSKLVWDLDGTASNAGVTFSVGDVTSAVITSATVFTITLTNTKAASLVSTVGFGADGLGSTNTADNIDVGAGFSRDASGNASTTDAGANLSPTYSDTIKPVVTSFTSSTADGGYKVGDTINITATVGEVILGGSAIKVTLDTGDEVTLTAATNGTTMVGAYTVGAGDSSTDLTIGQAFAVTSAVTDVYGNALSVTTLPANENLADNSALVIDTAIPTSTITAASYNSTGGIVTLTGTNFTTLAATSTDVKANLDWTKFVWDLDGATNDAGVSFALSDITSATVTNATSLAIDLTAAKQSALQATTGFAADGLDTTNTGDQIDITAGFTRDSVGNASTTDGAANLVPTYADSTAPTVSSFSSSTADGSYKSGDTINITANMTESILAGSQMSVTLDTNDVIELTATQNGTTLSGTYTISAADTDTDLGISSFSLTDAAANTDSVLDAYGNAMSSTTMPAGQNLSDNSALVVDNQATFLPTSISVGADPAAGATFALTFNEAVGNQAAIGTEIGNNAAFGATATKATTAWSADGKTATVTLGAGETFNADMTLTLASILDLADNEATNVLYTLDIA